MRIVAILALTTCALCRMLLPVNDATAQLLRENGFEPDDTWRQASYDDEAGPEPPQEFNARQKWGHCIHNITEEGKCKGGSWAVAAASVFADQICIKSSAKTNVHLSGQYLISCDKTDGGCTGAYTPKNIFQYFVDYGVPTEDCVPFKSSQDGQNGTCSSGQCTGTGNFVSYRSSKTVFAVSEVDIKREVMTIGPMFCKFDRHLDFDDYKSGIYYMATDVILEKGRAVKVFGWGVENTIHYWLVANSWSHRWGENGHFRIKIGECNICSVALGSDPIV